ncbi:MAG TPA: ATP-binding cassette domain-containing protein [Polyangia bacterium]
MVSVRLAGVTLERAGQTIVRHAHLTLAPGELVVVTGPRGAGKSLLLAAAAGLVTPREGSIEVAGRSLGSLRAVSAASAAIRRHIGYLPADPPFSREESALENVMLALAVRGFPAERASAAAHRALADVGADGVAKRAVFDLSPSERRLVAIARALCGPPAIAILDEPTAGLGHGDLERLTGAFANARAAGAALLCASNDGGFIDALLATGARQVRLADRTLAGAHGGLRVVADDDTPVTPPGEGPVFERAHDRDEGATNLDLPVHPARGAS